MNAADEGVWVFKAERATFPSAVFTTRERAEAWIEKHALTGVLTWFPVDESSYDWAVRNDQFKPKKPHHTTGEFIGEFSGAAWHYHYEKGKCTG